MLPGALLAAVFVLPLLLPPPGGVWTMATEICPGPGEGTFTLEHWGERVHLVGRAECQGDGYVYIHDVDAHYLVQPSADGGFVYEEPPFLLLRLDAEMHLVAFDDFNDVFWAPVRFAPAG